MRKPLSTFLLTTVCLLFLVSPLYAATGSNHSSGGHSSGGHDSQPIMTQPAETSPSPSNNTMPGSGIPASTSEHSMSEHSMSNPSESNSSTSGQVPSNSNSRKTDNLEVTVQAEPQHASVNEPVTYSFVIKDKATGRPVTDANVSLTLMLMDNSMSGMSMESDVTLQGEAKMDMEPGMYMLSLTPTQQGEWRHTLKISSPSLGESQIQFSINVEKSGPNWTLIGSVAALVFLAGIYAQILKRRNNALKEATAHVSNA